MGSSSVLKKATRNLDILHIWCQHDVSVCMWFSKLLYLLYSVQHLIYENTVNKSLCALQEPQYLVIALC